ncbi:helix-turn-helix transcriptional regulator [Longicatena caecimuris]|uniref:helix-turn-helix transcriptional regulator n=1 Tax=Longicatena caecimuris TaxID=1796635 RepID=UPI0018A92163|nr:AraC family transcriptional regulator [Longicatena caecimuris]
MEWINIVQKALNYMEDHLLDDIHSEQIAEAMYISNAYFQKTFKIVTRLSVSDYLRNRRLSLAGEELLLKNSKVMDTALKYGYESSESFTKAFTRFHGITPSVAQKTAGKLRYFSPLNI